MDERARAPACNHPHRRGVESNFGAGPRAPDRLLRQAGLATGWRRRLGEDPYSFALRNVSNRRRTEEIGLRQVRSHRAPGLIAFARVKNLFQIASPTMPLRPTSLVRAGVRRSASLRARCDRAATTLAGCALGRSAPRAKGSTGARSRRAATPGCQATLVALRSLWGGLAMVPRSSLGGRRPWWRSAAPGDAIFVQRLFRGLPPLGFGLDLLPEVRLGRILKDF